MISDLTNSVGSMDQLRENDGRLHRVLLPDHLGERHGHEKELWYSSG